MTWNNEIQGSAMKFPEWFYYKHSCIFIAYRRGAPSKYSPWAAMNLVHWRYQCWKHFLELLLWNRSQCHHHIFWISSTSWNLHPFKTDFNFGNNQKPFGAKAGKSGRCSISLSDFWTKTAWKCLVSWSIVMVENPMVGPKFRPLSTHSFM